MDEPTTVLRDEHVLILRALDLLETAAARATGGSHVDDDWWARLVAWLRGFADRNHHHKEERLLFPAMERAGVPAAGGPIGVMLEEHAEGRALIVAMETTAGADRVGNVRRYVRLLRAHIDKENDVLFPIADSVIDDTTRLALTRDFSAMADELGRDASLAWAEAELTGIAAALNVPAEGASHRA